VRLGSSNFSISGDILKTFDQIERREEDMGLKTGRLLEGLNGKYLYVFFWE
jgi:hypothetical protein